MNIDLWLSWFAAAAVVVIVASLLGRRRGVAIAVLGAGAWIIWSATRVEGVDTETLVWRWGVGTLALWGIAMWMSMPRRERSAPIALSLERDRSERDRNGNISAVEIATRFDEWLASHHTQADPWPDFGEFVRTILFQSCGARQVRAYRLLRGDNNQLYPMRRIGPDETDFPSARNGIVGHVVTSGKSYYDTDPSQGELVDSLASDSKSSSHSCVWCFAIRERRRTIGVVQVGQRENLDGVDPGSLPLIESVVGLCWAVLTETCRSRKAGFTDPVAGVLTHRAFVEAGERALADSYANSEPVALVNVSIEGLRRFADNGQWDLANQVLFEISTLLKSRLRDDDEIGIFDGSRFLLLLRRVDSSLAELIVRKLMERVTAHFESRDRWGGVLGVRCGVVGSGLHEPTLRTLISRATAKCQEARAEGVTLATDLTGTEAPVRPGQGTKEVEKA